MTVTITPSLLSGTIMPPPSKSQAHRVLLAAALARGTSEIKNLAASQDIEATLRCIRALGANAVLRDGGIMQVTGISSQKRGDLPRLDCGESGSTLRFLIPVALALAGGGVFTGEGRLMQRPLTPYLDIFTARGIAFSQKHDTLEVQGALCPGTYTLPGNVSSQFVTGLLCALPLLCGDSDIMLTAPLESAGYVNMTLGTLSDFGIQVEPTASGWHIPGNQSYRPAKISVEGDWSQAAFFFAADGLGSTVDVQGISPDSRQGDRIILDFGEKLAGEGTVTLDVSDCPDLVPPLAVWAALRKGFETRLIGAGRLRLKESDRLSAVTQVLNALGADVAERPDSLTIRGLGTLTGGKVDSWNDHRIAMMAAIAATRCTSPVTITGAEAVRKSYPTFWDDYAALGGKLEVQP